MVKATINMQFKELYYKRVLQEEICGHKIYRKQLSYKMVGLKLAQKYLKSLKDFKTIKKHLNNGILTIIAY